MDRIILATFAIADGAAITPTAVSDPTITDIDPIDGPGYGGTAVTITGTEFAEGATVTFGGEGATDVIVVSDTEITCVTPAHANGSVDVVVTNLDTGTVTATDGYLYRNSAPTIMDIDPVQGSTSGGQNNTITGTEFYDGITVDFGGEAATDVVVTSQTEITCVTPAHASGTVDVTVTNTDTGIETAVDGYEFIVVAAAALAEKNRLAAPGAWLLLLELTMPDDTVIKIVRNTESVVWRDGPGDPWLPFPFDRDSISTNSGGEIPNLNIRISNVTREIQAALEANGGAGGASIKIYIVHSDYLDDDEPVFQGDFQVLSAVADTEWATFTCGLGYPLTSRRPLWNWQKYICPFIYGDVRCAVADATKVTFPTCLKTFALCEERDNKARFGAERSIPGGYFG
jgi:hypothetical protein